MSAEPSFHAQSLSTVQLVRLDQLMALQVINPHGEALIALQGAQVLQYRPRGERPLIWLSDQAAFQRGQSVRGGIPVCWPWFGDLTRNPEAVRQTVQSQAQLPAHGLVRGQDWRLEMVTEDDTGTQVVLSYPSPAGLSPIWPHPVELRLSIRVGARLELELFNHNGGDRPVALSQALHTYFAIGDIHQAQIEGLEGVPFLDTLDQWQRKTEASPIRPSGEIDRVYQDVPSTLAIVDPVWGRRIRIHAEQSASAVVWNPWIDKSKRLSHFADDAWQQMLCIETANIMNDCLQLAPGESHRMRVAYEVEVLS